MPLPVVPEIERPRDFDVSQFQRTTERIRQSSAISRENQGQGKRRGSYRNAPFLTNADTVAENDVNDVFVDEPVAGEAFRDLRAEVQFELAMQIEKVAISSSPQSFNRTASGPAPASSEDLPTLLTEQFSVKA